MFADVMSDGTVLYWVLAGAALCALHFIAKPGRRH